MRRREFLAATVGAAGATAMGTSFWQQAFAAPARDGASPYGPLGDPDINGIRLPPGFSSRVLARSLEPVLVTGVTTAVPHLWHPFPDGSGVVPLTDGGWVYACNSEVFAPGAGGASALRFDAAGKVKDAYTILSGTSANCAGGVTPWGTWLSCEEAPNGQVYECRVDRPGQGVSRPALGMFSHEAAVVDPKGRRLYLTEDDLTDGAGGYYRFTPRRYPNLAAGRLEAATLTDGRLRWVPIDAFRPLNALLPTAQPRPAGTEQFAGAEGAFYDSGHVYFTTKSNDRVWDHDIAADRISVLYDAADQAAPQLTGVDNLTVSSAREIFVCEDGGDMQIVVITPDRIVAPFLQVVGQDQSEVSGVALDPTGQRMYFNSDRGGDSGIPAGLIPEQEFGRARKQGPGPGITYEVTGPFNRRKRT